jgi:lipopolysaccharide transport system permease protein
VEICKSKQKTKMNLPLTVYTPESPLKNPARLLREMFHDLLASRELAWRLFVRDTSAQYRQSILGYVWAFIPPLVASLPFVFLNSQGVVAIKGTSIPYPAFAMIGTIIWQVFVDALTAPLKTVTAAKSMLVRINFPREAILLAGLGQVIFNFLIRLVLLAGVFAWFRIMPPTTAFLFPLGILSLMMIGFMIGILLTPLGLLYNDIQQMIPIMTMFLMFLTPVIYPQPKTGLAGVITKWNPLTPLITTTRDWITLGTTSHLFSFLLVGISTLFLLFIGWVIYRLALPHIIARIGN